MTLSNDIITITGNLGNDPIMSTTKTGTPVLNFRVGSSTGRWDRQSGAWRDDGTSWYSVSAFGNLAENARSSLHIGDPVVITGRLRIKEWETDGRKGWSADLLADAIGHDLNRGTSGFARRIRSDAASAQPSIGPADDGASGEGEDTELDDFVTDEQRSAWDAHGMLAPDAPDDSEAEPAVEPGFESEQEPAYA